MDIPALPAFSRDIPGSAGFRRPTSQYPENPYFSLHPPYLQVSGGLYSITKFFERSGIKNHPLLLLSGVGIF